MILLKRFGSSRNTTTNLSQIHQLAQVSLLLLNPRLTICLTAQTIYENPAQTILAHSPAVYLKVVRSRLTPTYSSSNKRQMALCSSKAICQFYGYYYHLSILLLVYVFSDFEKDRTGHYPL
jgi:hypothetical protein